MEDFIELSYFSSADEDFMPLFVRPEEIVSVAGLKDGSKITLSNGKEYDVVEAPAVVLEEIDDMFEDEDFEGE
jgi:hypothetical protein